jgi:hypothetical protein
MITADEVKEALGIPPGDSIDDAWITQCTAAVNQLVLDLRPDAVDTDERIRWGALQLATRWYSRRNSSDVSAFVELGGPPPSIDRDVEVSLRIGRYFHPAVA